MAKKEVVNKTTPEPMVPVGLFVVSVLIAVLLGGFLHRVFFVPENTSDDLVSTWESEDWAHRQLLYRGHKPGSYYLYEKNLEKMPGLFSVFYVHFCVQFHPHSDEGDCWNVPIGRMDAGDLDTLKSWYEVINKVTRDPKLKTSANITFSNVPSYDCLCRAEALAPK